MSDDATVPLRRFIIDIVDQAWAADTLSRPDDLSPWLPSDASPEEGALDALVAPQPTVDPFGRGPPHPAKGNWNELGLPLINEDA